MSDKKTELYYVREFLNKPGYESIGLILAAVSMTEWTDKTGKVSKEISADLTLGDCSRQISLDFCLYGTDPKKENVQYKSALLRKTINDFLDAVDICLDEF